jgi:hypothetical protein
MCEVCQFGLLRAYAARDSDHVGELMDKVASLEETNRKLRKELSKKKELNKVLRKELSSSRIKNHTLSHGLAECRDRLWYYFGETRDTWSNPQCQNVYDTAKYYLDRAKKGEDDGGQY